MRIEKISDNQIRCTLNSSDLSSREINLLELAYGSEKARSLFHEMLEQADEEFGFDADDMPLMIEAIPLEGESIMLIITKVEDPEELDTRFSSFTPYNDTDTDASESAVSKGADDILDFFHQLLSSKGTSSSQAGNTLEQDSSKMNISRTFSFQTLDEVITTAAILNDIYFGENTLYKSPKNGHYYLVVNKSGHTPVEFNKICNILGEYGRAVKQSHGSTAYYEEHYTCIAKINALQKLASL